MAGNYQKTGTGPPFRHNDKNVENDSSVTATTNKKERNGELEVSEESENEEEINNVTPTFANTVKEIKRKTTIEKGIPRADNYEQLNDGVHLETVKKPLTDGLEKARKNATKKENEE